MKTDTIISRGDWPIRTDRLRQDACIRKRFCFHEMGSLFLSLYSTTLDNCFVDYLFICLFSLI